MLQPVQDAAAAVATAAEAEAAAAPELELQYDDSSVRRYVCEVLAADGAAAAAGSTAGEGAADGGGGPDGRVTGFRQLPGCLSDPALARAYSITWRPGLVAVRASWKNMARLRQLLCSRTRVARAVPGTALFFVLRLTLAAPLPLRPALAQAGGKDGVVSVWGSREAEAGTLAANAAVPPLLSGKLHKGWIAEVQFLSAACGNASGSGGDGCGGGGGLLRLLTAGNDGTVGLWDLGRAAEAGGRGGLVPQCLARATDLHSGASSVGRRMDCCVGRADVTALLLRRRRRRNYAGLPPLPTDRCRPQLSAHCHRPCLLPPTCAQQAASSRCTSAAAAC